MADKLAGLAEALGKHEDAAELREFADASRDAFNARFFNPTLHRCTNGGGSRATPTH
ncbi:hypothetical protein [Micromonospora cremea]|uniref:hypothetical protein n=1 Tax=Micromonospora cremea TaxID=709881 RepID=UPI001AD7E6CB|nr:hypothetical protein [Micromonospora cremea]